MDKNLDKYPWITFAIDLRKLSFNVWIKLGECLSKIEHLSKIPLKPDIAKEMHKVYLAKGVQATTAIEGNTLTENEVRLRLEKKLQLPPSKEYLGNEVDNIIYICNKITKDLHTKEPLIKIDDILEYNKKILDNIPLTEHIIPGKLRNYSVVVGSYRAPDYENVSILMEKYCKWLNGENFIIDKKEPILNNIIKAIVAHIYFAWIHPFGDGNGRTARMIEFFILINSGVPTPAAHLLSNHYNATRNEYYRQLDESSKKKDVTNFIAYAVQGFLDGLREQLIYVFRQVEDISWESYIYELFKDCKQHEITVKRRRNLVLELSKKIEPIPLSELMTISKSVMEAYGRKTQKTLSRDIKEILKMDLIEKTEKGYRVKKEKILSFIPLRKI